MTLHVGLGTFRPVKVDNVLDHHMHSEFYMVSQEAADKINNAKKNGGQYNICWHYKHSYLRISIR